MKLFQTIEIRVTDDEELLSNTIVGEHHGIQYPAIDFISPSQLVEMLPYADDSYIFPPMKAKHVAVFKFPAQLFTLPILLTDPQENISMHQHKIFASRKKEAAEIRTIYGGRIVNMTYSMILDTSLNPADTLPPDKDSKTDLTLLQFAETAKVGDAWNSELIEVIRVK